VVLKKAFHKVAGVYIMQNTMVAVRVSAGKNLRLRYKRNNEKKGREREKMTSNG